MARLRVGPIPPALSQASPPAVCAGGAMMSPRGLATGSAGTGSATTGEIADAIVETGSAMVIVIGVIGVPIGETTPASGRGTDVTIIDDREREAIAVRTRVGDQCQRTLAGVRVQAGCEFGDSTQRMNEAV